MGVDLGLDLDVGSMSDTKLLQQEREMYEAWVRYTTKSVCGWKFGAIGAIASLGVSLIVAAPIASSHVYFATYYGRQCDLCTAEVKERGLRSLATSYGKIAAGIATTVTIGAACAAIPFADGAQEAASAAAEYALAPLESAVDAAATAASHKVQVVAEAGNRVIEGVAEGAHDVLPEPDFVAVQDALSSLPVDNIERELLQEIAQLAEVTTEKLPEIVEVSIMTAGAHAIFIGCESRVGVEFTRQSKEDLAKYLTLRDGHLDSEATRQLVEKIFAEPVKFLTKFRDLSEVELLQRESELMATASARAVSLGCTVGFALTIAVPVKPVAALMQARSTHLLFCELRECEIELRQRKAPS